MLVTPVDFGIGFLREINQYLDRLSSSDSKPDIANSLEELKTALSDFLEWCETTVAPNHDRPNLANQTEMVEMIDGVNKVLGLDLVASSQSESLGSIRESLNALSHFIDTKD